MFPKYIAVWVPIRTFHKWTRKLKYIIIFPKSNAISGQHGLSWQYQMSPIFKVVNRGIDNKQICFLTCWQEQEAITKENVIVVYFQPRGRKDLRLKRERWRVLWGPCLLWIGLTLSVLILQHVSDSDSFRYQASTEWEHAQLSGQYTEK